MALKNPLDLHHNFVKLAEDSGFSFNVHKARHHIDWNKIKLVDVDNLIRDRRFHLIEQHVNDILDCALESEFDVRILDEGVAKMFRLAQLTIEYQQFCRHYLDRSVFVLRDELSSVMQQLEVTRKELREKDDEVKKLRRKCKHNFRPPLMYGNDNIANMILKTLSNNGEMLPTTSLLDLSHQYNKCDYCDKVFLNQLYVKSHIARRHAHIVEISQKDSPKKEPENDAQSDKVKLYDEIMELRSKLKDMETSITNINTKTTTVDTGIQSNAIETEDNIAKQTREVETLANTEHTFLEKKLEEWKNEEHDKYTKEIEALRSQIMETINSLKLPNNVTNNNHNNEFILIQQLQLTIKEQGEQIAKLTQEISDNNIKAKKEKADKRSEIEEQLRQWMQKEDVQTKQHNILVQNLKDVAKEAKEARATAEAERYRAAQLEALLEQRTAPEYKEKKSGSRLFNDSPRTNAIANVSTQRQRPDEIIDNDLTTNPKNEENPTKVHSKSKLMVGRKTLDELHQKAQELLNMKSSSSSDETSSEQQSPRKPVKNVKERKSAKQKTDKQIQLENRGKKQKKKEEIDLKKPKYVPSGNDQGNGLIIPRSPLKVVRAKLTEEVNNRLVAAGVDPLKNGLHTTDYSKQRIQLQKEQRLKAKRLPEFDKVRNSIIAFLDSKAGVEISYPSGSSSENITPTKLVKSFSLTSVISNVKNKALSLVKKNETVKRERKALNADVAKKAIALLKTPPGSGQSSPLKTHHIYEGESHDFSTTQKYIDSFPVQSLHNKPAVKVRKLVVSTQDSKENSDSESDHKYYDSASLTKSAKSIENLIKSPVRRPSTANGDYNNKLRREQVAEKTELNRKSLSVSNVSAVAERKSEIYSDKHAGNNENTLIVKKNTDDLPVLKNTVEDYAHASPKQAKGVLKNAPSTNSLNKKKVLFDLDAIQMKSVSASPSLSTEKSDTNEKYELGLINLNDDEWDISSIDNEPLKNNDYKIKISLPSRTSPKIAELKQTIESQLHHRKETTPTAPVGSIDVLGGPATRVPSIGGSNTTLGSSVFDEDPVISPNHSTFIKSKIKHSEKDDSEFDLSEFSMDGMTDGKRDSF